MATLEETFQVILERLNKESKTKLHKGEITINAKGEAQIRVRAYSDEVTKIGPALKTLIEAVKQVCKDKHIKLAGSP